MEILIRFLKIHIQNLKYHISITCNHWRQLSFMLHGSQIGVVLTNIFLNPILNMSRKFHNVYT